MASKMAALLLVALFSFSNVFCQPHVFTDPLKIEFPNLLVHSVDNGNMYLESLNGDIMIGSNNTRRILFDGEDLNYIIQLITSKPPVWEDNSPFAFLGEYHAGDRMDVTVIAKDPEGQQVVYTLVAGVLPPGIKLDGSLGRIYGLIPDSDATYTITIRATDVHGHYADSVFKIVTRGIVYCSRKPCVNQGICQDLITGYKCFCPNPYGGLRCDIDCRSNQLIGQTNQKKIPDAALTGYNMYSSYVAYGARMNAGGWYGIDSTSYLQVDLGNVSNIENFQIKGRDSSSRRYYYTSSFFIKYSIDGNTFHNFTSSSNGNVYAFSGISYSSVHTENLPEPLAARFIRFYPLSWNHSYKPYMNIEINGCHQN